MALERLAPQHMMDRGIHLVDNDLLKIGDRIRELDPTLVLCFDPAIEQFVVIKIREDGGTPIPFKWIQPGELDERVIHDLQMRKFLYENEGGSKGTIERAEKEWARQEEEQRRQKEEMWAALEEEVEGRLAEKESLKNLIDKSRGILVSRDI